MSTTRRSAGNVRRSGQHAERLEDRRLLSASINIVVGWNGAAPYNNPSMGVPPDTMMALGPSYWMELMNGAWRVGNRSTLVLTQNTTDAAFWQAALPSTQFSQVHDLTDPRVTYDPLISRFIATEDANAATGDTANSEVLFAVSAANDPNGPWRGNVIATNQVLGGNATWLDQPRLGLDKNGVYITGDEILASNRNLTVGDTVIALPIGDMLWTGANYPTTTGVGRWFQIGTNQHAVRIQPSNDFNASKPTGSAGAQLLAAVDRSYIDGTGANKIDVATIPITWASGAPSIGLVSNAPLSVVPTDYPPPANAAQPGANSPPPLNVGDGRLSNVTIVNGNLWTAVPAVFNLIGPGYGYDGALIVKMSTTNLTSAQYYSGLQGNFIDCIYPSIAVNVNNQVAVGFTEVSSVNGISPTSAAIGVAPNVGLTAITALSSGNKPYYGSPQTILPDGSTRWGDYSATMVDPNNLTTFATIQEDSHSPTGGNNQYTTLAALFTISTGAAAPASAAVQFASAVPQTIGQQSPGSAVDLTEAISLRKRRPLLRS